MIYLLNNVANYVFQKKYFYFDISRNYCDFIFYNLKNIRQKT